MRGVPGQDELEARSVLPPCCHSAVEAVKHDFGRTAHILDTLAEVHLFARTSCTLVCGVFTG